MQAQDKSPTAARAGRPGERQWLDWERRIDAKFPQAYPITTDALAKLLLLQSNHLQVVLLDCRSPQEFAVSRLHASAVQVDEDDPIELIQQIVNEKLHGGDTNSAATVVFYCSAGYRSAILAQAWLDSEDDSPSSHHKVYSLKGGIFTWGNEKRALVREDGHGNVVAATKVYAHNKNMANMLEDSLHYLPHKEGDGKKQCAVM